MATKALPIFCILFLLFSASFIFPSAEGLRTLEESKAGISTGNGANLDPNRPVCIGGSCPSRGDPYTTRPCLKGRCPSHGVPYTGRSPPPPTIPPASN